LRALNEGEIKILTSQNFEKFTEQELDELSKGTASFRTFSRADKVMEKVHKHFQFPPSRTEVYQGFVQKKDLELFIVTKYNKLVIEFDILAGMLKDAGIITQEMIDAAVAERKAKATSANEG